MVHIREVSLECKIVQSKGNIVSDMDGEKVMLNVQKGKYYNLGEIGGEIWDLIENPIMVTQLVTTLLSKYNIKQIDCEEQVLSFLECLFQEGLIYIKDQPK
ncbi:PqqD family protein [Bacillus pseudomycoides]|uniref:PqqD family protein n=1 Tax=Bacillus pseudomycoides TaxID=64104 RepID=A0AA91ZTZ8_9BACI|nr:MULTISPECIES: lasso peptide biosynthesis PqqD family chaperone [Bacillus]PEB52128.1 PqqD family protein [Bacillus sp. AFS098217]PED82133.1 PqqD family protein [Bacillus pseudomycoides]PEU10856.1 PqqD family protein [Bacillus sp. AFS019443]PEU20777.1 PqqD family protein [Bacillus sp. AFS014408]PFW61284.1 PqqD family protein [Bacillus sp. AFS075034]